MKPNINIKTVLLAPLDWGLGHATRCIPLIDAFLALGWKVVIAADGGPAVLLKEQFPAISIIHLGGYKISYSRRRFFLPFRLLFQLPRLLKTIAFEKKWLSKVVRELAIDLVISDNRYGLSTRQCPCVFITHQLLIKTPFKLTDALLQKINYHYINQFTACWVPDMPTNGLAGELSHPVKMPGIPVTYIHPLSRFKKSTAPIVFDACFSISGPEPQRTLLENTLSDQLAGLAGNFVVVRGLPDNKALPHSFPTGVTVYNHLPTDGLNKLFVQSNLIVCRSGYTTIMELMTLGKKALLIPTPGQTEQEYLASYLSKQQFALSANQASLQLAQSLNKLNTALLSQPVIPIFSADLLVAQLDKLFALQDPTIFTQ